MHKIFKISAIICATLAFSAVGGVGASALTYQTSVDQSFTINDTLTIILSDSKVSIDNLLPGQSADSSILDVTVLSNNPYGYKLSGTVGDSNYTADALYNNGDNTKTFTSIGYGNNKTSLSDFDNDTWGYSYSLDGGTTWQGSAGNTGYTGLPLYNSSNTMTFLDTDDISASTGDTMKFKIGAKASSTKESGEYNNTINFVATGYSFPLYTVTYNANGGTVTPTSEQVRGTSVTLPTPTNGSKIFGGWCDGTVAGSVCNGTTYQAGDTYTPTGNVTLTAIWPDLFGIATMQEMTSQVCSNTTTPNASATQIDADGSHHGDKNYVPRTTLTDSRDGTDYLVSKLADGNCWMSQNLELKLTANQAVEAYDFNTNQTFSFTPNNTTQTSTDTTWAQSGGESRSYTYADNTYYGGTNISQTAPVKTSGEPYEKAGVLYNWYAATAGTGGTGSTSEVYGSICPKGWRLPANATGASNSFSHLAGVYGLPTTNTGSGYSRQLQFPLQFNRPGNYRWSDGKPPNQGAGGFYWSSVGYGTATNACHFGFYSRRFEPQNDNRKGFGFTVRCLADD